MRTLKQVMDASEPALKQLNRAVEFATRQLIERAYQGGVEIRITHGFRSHEQQQALYNQGRYGNAGSIVTNARPGRSNHNYGLAIDFVLMASGYDMKADKDGDGQADWMEVVAIAKTLGFAWGGDWVSFKDNPHFEMMFGLSIDQLQAGKRPTAAQEQAVIDKINALVKGDEEVRKIEELEALVQVQDARIASLEKRLNMSGKETYAKAYETAIRAAKDAGMISTSADKSKIELNTIQMLHNLKLTDPAVVAFLKKIAEGGVQ